MTLYDVFNSKGGGQMELVRGGADIEVNASNVYDYVRKYAEYRMIKSQEKALEVNLLYSTSNNERSLVGKRVIMKCVN